MNSYVDLKQFISNINKTVKVFTDGRYNLTDLAIFDVIKYEPKSAKEIAEYIGISMPAISLALNTHVRRKCIKLLPDKCEGKKMYILNDEFKFDFLDDIFEPLSDMEKKQFIKLTNKLNNNMKDIINA